MSEAGLWRKINAPRDHRWAMPHFSAYIDGELSSRADRRMRGHESICPECRQAIASLRKIVSALPGLASRKTQPSDAARTAATDIMRAIDADDDGGSSP